MPMRCAFCMVMDATSKKEGVCQHCLPHTEGKSPHRTMKTETFNMLQEMLAFRSEAALKELVDTGTIDEMIGKMKK